MEQADPIERDIEAALRPRAFICDGECFSFVNGLEKVASRIEQLVQRDPARACVLYETFLGACTAKADELDDSSGSFGQFAGDIICGWIKARCTADLDRDEAIVILFSWMDDGPFAFFHGCEKPMIEAFDTNGLATLERRIRSRLEASLSATPALGAIPGDRPEYWQRHWGAILRTIYITQKDRDAYIALAAQTGLSPEDCLSLAKLDRLSGQLANALAWVERCSALYGGDSQTWSERLELIKLQCDLLVALGRTAEARAMAWRVSGRGLWRRPSFACERPGSRMHTPGIRADALAESSRQPGCPIPNSRCTSAASVGESARQIMAP